jgi:hypothetical protein
MCVCVCVCVCVCLCLCVCVCVCVCFVLFLYHLTSETTLRYVNGNAVVRLWFLKLSVKTFDLPLSRQARDSA